MSDNMSATEFRIFEFLRGKMGIIVPYAEFEHIVSVKKGTANLRQIIYRLSRKSGCLIETIPMRGVRLRTVKKMPVITHNFETQNYADEIQEAIATTMRRHAKLVGFEDEIAIIGVAIGALLDQLPKADRDHYTKILIRNVKEARKYAIPVNLQ